MDLHFGLLSFNKWLSVSKRHWLKKKVTVHHQLTRHIEPIKMTFTSAYKMCTYFSHMHRRKIIWIFSQSKTVYMAGTVVVIWEWVEKGIEVACGYWALRLKTYH